MFVPQGADTPSPMGGYNLCPPTPIKMGAGDKIFKYSVISLKKVNLTLLVSIIIGALFLQHIYFANLHNITNIKAQDAQTAPNFATANIDSKTTQLPTLHTTLINANHFNPFVLQAHSKLTLEIQKTRNKPINRSQIRAILKEKTHETGAIVTVQILESNMTVTSLTNSPINYSNDLMATTQISTDLLPVFTNTPHNSDSLDYVPIAPYSAKLSHIIKITTKPSTMYKTTEDLPYGAEKILQNGKPGMHIIKVTTKLSTNHNDVKKQTVAVLVKSTPSTPTTILTGAPPQYRTVEIEGKQIEYYRKLYVWATSYDSSCYGCNDITATGKKLTYGIVAVDPKVIPLHSCLYIPGYGYAQAEDTGGAIKGNKIDLAFEDIKYGWWSARYTWIYLVDCKDAKLPFEAN